MFEFVPKEADEEVSSHLDTESLEEIKKDLAQAIHGERHFFSVFVCLQQVFVNT